jgi:hypothetical protein
VCIGGSGWFELGPPCRYTFTLNGSTIASDQPDGLYGPPNRGFIVPSLATGDHPVRVQLRQNTPDSLKQQRISGDAIPAPPSPFLTVLAANTADSKIETSTSVYDGRNAVVITYTPGPNIRPCKKIVFVQVIRRFARKTGETDAQAVITSITDWRNFPNAADRAGVETASKRRVDQTWAVKNPYYFAEAAPPDCDTGFHKTGCLCSPKPLIAASMLDAPNTRDQDFPLDATFGARIDKAILKFEVYVYCAEGEAQGTYLGHWATWECHQVRGADPTIENRSTGTGTPGTDFLAAVTNWTTAKGFAAPAAVPPRTCP